MASLKDISAACGVSVSTVSKALKGYHDVSEETTRYVVETADRMGYFCEREAPKSRETRTCNIGVFFEDESEISGRSDLFSGIMFGFKEEVGRAGYDITFIDNQDGPGGMSPLSHAKYRNLDGALVLDMNYSDPEVLQLVNSSLPIVTIDHVYDNRTAVLSDIEKGMRELIFYLYRKGHRKIACVFDDRGEGPDSYSLGFYNAMDKLDLPVPKEYVKEVTYHSVMEAEKRTMELLHAKTQPTCILYPDDYTASCGMEIINAEGLRVPEDISVAVFDGNFTLRGPSPFVTAVCKDAGEVGRAAGMELVRHIEKPDTTLVRQIVLPEILLEGRSVRNLCCLRSAVNV